MGSVSYDTMLGTVVRNYYTVSDYLYLLGFLF